MDRLLRRHLATALVLSFILLLLACSGGGGSNSGGSNNVTPTTPSLSSLQISPGASSLATGGSQQFTVTGKYSDGSSKDLTTSAQWTSSDTSVVSVAAGKATAIANGIVTVTATSGTMKSSATVAVTNAASNLTGLTVSPAASSLPVNTKQQFSATGTYADGSSRDLTGLVNWSSSATAVATIDGSGMATGVAAGTTTISATLSTVTGSTSLTVTAPTISSIVVTPDGLTLGIGISQQYTATAIYSDGSSQDLVSGVTWSSSSLAVATINSSGLATTAGAGNTTITAQVGSLSDTATLTVVPAQLTSISISPATASMALGTAQQFSAVGSFDDGSTQLLTSVSWSSSSTGVATVSSSGMATAMGAGSATITASSGSVSGTASLTVTGATVVSIAVTPAASNMPVGSTKQFTATATFSDTSTQDVTGSVLWSSSNPTAATINAQGLVTSVAAGSTTIGAVLNSVSGSTGLTVTTVQLVSITVTPSNPKIAVRTFVKFTATGTYSDGSTTNNLAGVSWKSSSPRFASVRSSGLAFGKRVGSVTITASAFGLKGTTTLTIGSGKLSSIVVTPANPSVTLGSTQQFTATGSFTDGTTQDVSIAAHWNSSSSSVATVANAPSVAGLATTNGKGTTSIGANSGGVTASTTLTVQ